MPRGIGNPLNARRAAFSLLRPDVEGSVDPNATPIEPSEAVEHRRDAAGNVLDVGRAKGWPPAERMTHSTADALQSQSPGGEMGDSDNARANAIFRNLARRRIHADAMRNTYDDTLAGELAERLARDASSSMSLLRGAAEGGNVGRVTHSVEGELAPEEALRNRLMLMETRRRSRNPLAPGGVSGPTDEELQPELLKASHSAQYRTSLSPIDTLGPDLIPATRALLRRADPADSLSAPGGPQRQGFSIQRPDVEGSVDPNATPLRRDELVEIPNMRPTQVRRVDPNTPRGPGGTRTTPEAIERAGSAERMRRSDEDLAYEDAVSRQIDTIEEGHSLHDMEHPDPDMVDQVANDRIARIRALANPEDPGPQLDLDPRAKMIQRLLAMELEQSSQQPLSHRSGSGRSPSHRTGPGYRELSELLDDDQFAFPLDPDDAQRYLRMRHPLFRAGIRGRNPNEQDFSLKRPDVEGSVDPSASNIPRELPVANIRGAAGRNLRGMLLNQPAGQTVEQVERAGGVGHNAPGTPLGGGNARLSDEDRAMNRASARAAGGIREVVGSDAEARVMGIDAALEAGLDYDRRDRAGGHQPARPDTERELQNQLLGMETRNPSAGANRVDDLELEDALADESPLPANIIRDMLRERDPLWLAGIRRRTMERGSPQSEEFAVGGGGMQTNPLRTRIPKAAENIASLADDLNIPGGAAAAQTKLKSVGPIDRKVDNRTTADSMVRRIVGPPDPVARDRTQTLLSRARNAGRDPLVLPVEPSDPDDLGPLSSLFAINDDEFDPLTIAAQRPTVDDFPELRVPAEEGFEPIQVKRNRPLKPSTIANPRQLLMVQRMRRLNRPPVAGEKINPETIGFAVGDDDELDDLTQGHARHQAQTLHRDPAGIVNPRSALSVGQAGKLADPASRRQMKAGIPKATAAGAPASARQRGRGRFEGADVRTAGAQRIGQPASPRTSAHAGALASLGGGRRTIDVNRPVANAAPRIGDRTRVLDIGDRPDVVVPPGAGGQQRVQQQPGQAPAGSLKLAQPVAGAARDRGIMFRDMVMQALQQRQQQQQQLPAPAQQQRLPGPRGIDAIRLNLARQGRTAVNPQGPSRQALPATNRVDAARMMMMARLRSRRPGIKRLTGLKGVRQRSGKIRRFEQLTEGLVALLFTEDAA